MTGKSPHAFWPYFLVGTWLFLGAFSLAWFNLMGLDWRDHAEPSVHRWYWLTAARYSLDVYSLPQWGALVLLCTLGPCLIASAWIRSSSTMSTTTTIVSTACLLLTQIVLGIESPYGGVSWEGFVDEFLLVRAFNLALPIAVSLASAAAWTSHADSRSQSIHRIRRAIGVALFVILTFSAMSRFFLGNAGKPFLLADSLSAAIGMGRSTALALDAVFLLTGYCAAFVLIRTQRFTSTNEIMLGLARFASMSLLLWIVVFETDGLVRLISPTGAYAGVAEPPWDRSCEWALAFFEFTRRAGPQCALVVAGAAFLGGSYVSKPPDSTGPADP